MCLYLAASALSRRAAVSWLLTGSTLWNKDAISIKTLNVVSLVTNYFLLPSSRSLQTLPLLLFAAVWCYHLSPPPRHLSPPAQVQLYLPPRPLQETWDQTNKLIIIIATITIKVTVLLAVVKRETCSLVCLFSGEPSLPAKTGDHSVCGSSVQRCCSQPAAWEAQSPCQPPQRLNL